MASISRTRRQLDLASAEFVPPSPIGLKDIQAFRPAKETVWSLALRYIQQSSNDPSTTKALLEALQNARLANGGEIRLPDMENGKTDTLFNIGNASTLARRVGLYFAEQVLVKGSYGPEDPVSRQALIYGPPGAGKTTITTHMIPHVTRKILTLYRARSSHCTVHYLDVHQLVHQVNTPTELAEAVRNALIMAQLRSLHSDSTGKAVAIAYLVLDNFDSPFLNLRELETVLEPKGLMRLAGFAYQGRTAGTERKVAGGRSARSKGEAGGEPLSRTLPKDTQRQDELAELLSAWLHPDTLVSMFPNVRVLWTARLPWAIPTRLSRHIPNKARSFFGYPDKQSRRRVLEIAFRQEMLENLQKHFLARADIVNQHRTRPLVPTSAVIDANRGDGILEKARRLVGLNSKDSKDSKDSKEAPESKDGKDGKDGKDDNVVLFPATAEEKALLASDRQIVPRYANDWIQKGRSKLAHGYWDPLPSRESEIRLLNFLDAMYEVLHERDIVHLRGLDKRRTVGSDAKLEKSDLPFSNPLEIWRVFTDALAMETQDQSSVDTQISAEFEKLKSMIEAMLPATLDKSPTEFDQQLTKLKGSLLQAWNHLFRQTTGAIEFLVRVTAPFGHSAEIQQDLDDAKEAIKMADDYLEQNSTFGEYFGVTERSTENKEKMFFTHGATNSDLLGVMELIFDGAQRQALSFGLSFAHARVGGQVGHMPLLSESCLNAERKEYGAFKNKLYSNGSDGSAAGRMDPMTNTTVPMTQNQCKVLTIDYKDSDRRYVVELDAMFTSHRIQVKDDNFIYAVSLLKTRNAPLQHLSGTADGIPPMMQYVWYALTDMPTKPTRFRTERNMFDTRDRSKRTPIGQSHLVGDGEEYAKDRETRKEGTKAERRSPSRSSLLSDKNSSSGTGHKNNKRGSKYSRRVGGSSAAKKTAASLTSRRRDSLGRFVSKSS